MRRGTLLHATVFFFCVAFELPALELESPDGRLRLVFDLEEIDGAPGCPVWSLSRNGTEVVLPSRLGLEIEDAPLLDHLRIAGRERRSRDRVWRPVCGERSTVRDRHHELEVELVETRAPRRSLLLRFRLFNEGAAFSYMVPEQESLDGLSIRREHSEFRFPGDPECWAVYSAQGEYERTRVSRLRRGCERPLVARLEAGPYIAVGEASLVDFARMKLAPISKDINGVVSDLSGEVEARLPLETPWRYVLQADSPGGLLERNDLIRNLNAPCAIEDTSWIRPGKVIREVTLTTRGGKACVDFAAEHGLQFVEYDAGWYGHEYSDASDATTVTLDPKRSKGPLDLQEVIRYAGERDIGVILYVNRRQIERQLDEILPLYREWGVSGVKYGFVQVGSQRWTSWLHEAVRKAAENRLMVDIHDEYRPTGYSRTYPNLMTQEGIAGDETRPSNELTLTILFTRMIAGAADNTICYYDRRVDRNASHAYQLAKAVCFFSPWQFLYWYDRPVGSRGGTDPEAANVIGDEPELEFFAEVPTVWDDTRVLHGEIGKYAVIARRSGERWFVGCMNAGEPRTLSVPLDFLEPDVKYRAHIYRDDPTVSTRTHVGIERRAVDHRTVLEAAMSPQGGMAVRIHPVSSPR